MGIKPISIKLLKSKLMEKLNILLLIAVLYSCNKEIPVTHVSGVVVNSGTNQPIDSVSVIIQDGVASDNILGSQKNVGTGASQEVLTSKDGKFEFNFKANNPFISATKKQYRFHNPNGAYEIYELLPGNTYKLTLKMDAYAFFNPFFKSISPVSSNDTVIVYILVYINGKLSPWTGWKVLLLGKMYFNTIVEA